MSEASDEEALVPAIDRLQRGIERLTELMQNIQEWTETHWQHPRYEISDDGLTCTFFVDHDPPPPVREWGYLYSEAVHHIRSSFNILLHQIYMAEHPGAEPPRDLQFPIALTGPEWRNQKKWLAGLPPEVIAAVESVQPKLDPPTVNTNALAMLKRHSNLDKHVLDLKSHVLNEGMQIDSSVTLEGDAPTEMGELVPLGDERGLFQVRTQRERIVAADPKGIRAEGIICIEDPLVGPVGLLGSLPILTQTAAMVHHHIIEAWSGKRSATPVPES